ncbi:tetraacyldisaccharide 4'-kinase [Nonlabens marinus]|uniref:Tetraacyldisaccharide 4'-kinase n=1 Tax=Nonlabens marinus S1-08 TaxID=1454201 RepID=W8VZB5_9FLAO|nr:tetraacyldisaccharide 4'-kinase [Nonlabens marinus]BAO54286.1 tetraacyldisaccharide 4'-kinase [Nonlabens marinus S1-08]
MTNLRFLLYPFSVLYDGITGLRNWGFDQGFLEQRQFDIPIIAVGNLSTGGTGKSPMIEYLIRQNSDKKVAVLSRGYGRKTRGFLEVFEKNTPVEVGDEPLQFKLKFKDSIVVAVCEKRVDGVETLLRNHQLDLILLDDAYQHRYVKASTYVLLTSYGQPFYYDHLLPAGNLRESRSGAYRASHIVVTKCPEDLSETEQQQIIKKINPKSYQGVYFSTIGYAAEAIGISGSLTLHKLSGQKITVITGIAKPDYFVSYLKEYMEVDHLYFPDHYNFTQKDIDRFREKELIITTEKDFVRLKQYNLEHVYYVPITMEFLGEAPKF